MSDYTPCFSIFCTVYHKIFWNLYIPMDPKPHEELLNVFVGIPKKEGIICNRDYKQVSFWKKNFCH